MWPHYMRPRGTVQGIHLSMGMGSSFVKIVSTFSYLTLGYFTLSYLALPYLALPYLALPYLALPWVTPYLPLSYLPSLTLSYPLPKTGTLGIPMNLPTHINTIALSHPSHPSMELATAGPENQIRLCSYHYRRSRSHHEHIKNTHLNRQDNFNYQSEDGDINKPVTTSKRLAKTQDPRHYIQRRKASIHQPTSHPSKHFPIKQHSPRVYSMYTQPSLA